MTSNYEMTLQNAMKRFCSYDINTVAQKPGVTDCGDKISLRFLGMQALIHKKTGKMTVDGENADFCEVLSVFDWLCDGKSDAKASNEFCPVSSLPGVLVSGQGLDMSAPELAREIDLRPDAFLEICREMGAIRIDSGDIGIQLDVFFQLPMQMKFYHSDEEFLPTMTFLWDKNILDFVRYETVYYICATLKKHLLFRMRQRISPV